MVELEKILDSDEKEWLKQFIGKHRELTGSEPAGQLLEKWQETLGKIVRVMPMEYRMVLEQQNAKAA